MKKIFGLLLAFIGCFLGGLLVAGVILSMITDVSFSDFLNKLISAPVAELLVPVVVAIACVMLAVPLLVIIHEGGHLVAGLMTGYKFVSFRVFNITLIKAYGKIRLKRFAIAGTGGQCLLTPPDMPIEKVPTVWYNLGGVTANILALVLLLPLCFAETAPWLKSFAAIFCIMDAFLIVLNSVPMKLNGIGNDGYNSLHLDKNPLAKRGVMLQLRVNAEIQNGVRPKDMPDEWFDVPEKTDFRNPLEVSILIMHASRLIDEGRMDDAYGEFSELYRHKAEIGTLYTKEIECELLFLCLILGKTEEADDLLTPELKKYMTAYSKMMSSKLRILGVVELYHNHDCEAARTLFDNLIRCSESYLLQGEVKSDLAILEGIHWPN